MQLCFVEIFKQSRKNNPNFCQFSLLWSVALFASQPFLPLVRMPLALSVSHIHSTSYVFGIIKKLFQVERMQGMYWCGCFCFECCREVEMQPGKVFFSKLSLSLKVYQNKHRTAVENHSGGKVTVVAIISCSFSTIMR